MGGESRSGPGLLQRPGRDESGAAVSCLSPSARGLRVWAWAVGLGLHGCLDLWDGPQQEEREAEPPQQQQGSFASGCVRGEEGSS